LAHFCSLQAFLVLRFGISTSFGKSGNLPETQQPKAQQNARPQKNIISPEGLL
tara:strand:- start:48 stop:206 length:159 start_codon:yes stop_codon:yes gene_type:complete